MPEKRPCITGRKSRNLPVSGLHEWLPQRMLACVIVGVVERLDLSRLSHDGAESNAGQTADPAKLLALMFFGYTSGVFSSRELEQATYQSETYRFITANTHPHHLVIAGFRKRFASEIEKLFMRILGISYMMKQANLGGPRLDRKQLEKRLRVEAGVLLKCAAAADARAHDAGRNPQHIPDHVAGGSHPRDARPGAERSPESGRIEEPAQSQAENPAETGRQASPRDFQTFTFLPRKQVVSALDPGASRSIMAPLFEPERADIPGKTKRRDSARSTPGKPTRYRPASSIAASLLAGVAAVLLFTLYVDRRIPAGTDQASLPDQGIQSETSAEPVIQAEFAALTNTLLENIEPEQDPAPVDSQPAMDTISTGQPASAERTLPVQHKAGEEDAAAAVSTPVLPVTEPATAQTDEPHGPESNRVQHENWLLAQPSSHYMLQLLWGRKLTTLQDFVARNPLPGTSAIYRDLKNDKARYVLLYGPYASYREARADMQTLPQQILTNRPWPRKLQSIQNIIVDHRVATGP